MDVPTIFQWCTSICICVRSVKLERESCFALRLWDMKLWRWSNNNSIHISLSGPSNGEDSLQAKIHREPWCHSGQQQIDEQIVIRKWRWIGDMLRKQVRTSEEGSGRLKSVGLQRSRTVEENMDEEGWEPSHEARRKKGLSGEEIVGGSSIRPYELTTARHSQNISHVSN